MASKNHTLISIANITKDQLDELRKIYGDLSYDKLISTMLVEIYKMRICNELYRFRTI
jgi:hypothetical protein